MLQRALDTGRASLKKFRYFLWYGLMLVLLVAVISINLTSLPSGLSEAEMQQAVASSNSQFTILFDWTINGLYNGVQYLSTEIFGITRLGLVLPSLIFAVLTIILFSLICVRWFKSSVALVSTFIVASSSVFISLARSGTPDIMIPFWSSLLIFAGLNLLTKDSKPLLWKIIGVLAGIGLIYTPLGIYPLLAIIISSVLHPHIRSRIRRMSRLRLIILAIIFLFGIAPITINLVMVPAHINQMTAADTIWYSLSHLPDNLIRLYNTYFNSANVGFDGSQVTPVFSLVAIVILLLGIFRSIAEHFTARSYILLSWTALTLVVAVVVPQSVSLLFLPTAILIAIGIETLIASWFSLFPFNPYARIVGLVPLSLIFIIMATGNISHYYNSHLYLKNDNYNQSIVAVQQSLRREGDKAVLLVTDAGHESFYRTLMRQHKYLTVTTTTTSELTLPTLVTPGAKVSYSKAPSRIVTSGFKDDSVILRVYQPQ